MTTYSAIAAGEKDAESPIDESLIGKLDNNPHAMFEGASGAPRLQSAALATELQHPWELISTLTASASATLDFEQVLTSTYDEYIFRFVNIHPATNGAHFQAQFGTGATPTWQTSTYTASTHFQVSDGTNGVASSTSTGGLSGKLLFDEPTVSKFQIVGIDTRYSNLFRQDAAEIWITNAAVTSMRFKFSTGNIASGYIMCFGRRL